MNPEKPHIPNADDAIKPLEVLHIPELRISSASFSRIRDDVGRLALMVNKNRAQKGDVVLMPIGGAIEASDEGIKELQGMLSIEPENFEKGNDLRFKMNGKDANKYREWFLSDKNREINPTRELIEELVEEEGVLEEEDLKEVEVKLAGYDAQTAETSRTGQEGATTLRLLEIFDTKLSEETLAKLVQAAEKENSPIRFATEEEIRSGKTNDNIEIKKVSLSLLDAKETLKDFV